MQNILFVGSECVPYAKSGGLGDVMGALPKAIASGNMSVAVIMPLYKQVEEAYLKDMEFIGSLEVSLSWRKQYMGLYRLKTKDVTYYFIDNKQYFQRESFYGYFDDAERFAFFAKAAIASFGMLDEFPQIIHCNDWQTAMVPVYLKTIFEKEKMYSKIRTVFTIHNIEYQGKFGKHILGDVLGLEESHRCILELDGALNYMKAAIVCCDKLTTVSPSYARELTYPFYGRGLEDIVKQNSYKLQGILNGIDVGLFNPSTDESLFFNYDSKSIEKKIQNKVALQKELGLDIRSEVPIVSMVTRLVDHKGIGLLMGVFDELLQKDIQFVLLGTGEERYERYFLNKSHQFPNRVAAVTAFSGILANRIYAGADMFLMPSISEPCGLSQLIALRYGTIPIVRAIGGLSDSVKSFNPGSGQGNGITFQTVNAHDMLWAIYRGLEYFQNKALWTKLVLNACKSDNSWKNSAKQYRAIYEALAD